MHGFDQKLHVWGWQLQKKINFRYVSVTKLKIYFSGANTIPSKTLLKNTKTFVKTLFRRLRFLLSFKKPLKRRLLNLLTFKISLFQRLGFLKPFENLWIEGYDLRPGLERSVSPVCFIAVECINVSDIL